MCSSSSAAYYYYNMEESDPEPVGYLTGSWVANNTFVPVARITTVKDTAGNKIKIAMAFDDKYTKMVDLENKFEGRYYTGPVSDFDASKWNTYDKAPLGNYKYTLTK
jgi:hypothetical protein